MATVTVRQGILRCPEPACLREHPLVDGVPILVPDLRAWSGFQLDAVLRRRDLTHDLTTLFGDAAGPDSEFERDRSTLSTYAASHWGDLQDARTLPRERTAASVADAAIELLSDVSGPLIDLGCGPGRASFELAKATGQPVVAIDLNFDFLRLAAEIQATGTASYAQRRLGLVYEARTIAAGAFEGANVTTWCAEATALPFADATFAGGISLNLLDSVGSPVGHLQEAARVIATGGALVIASPYEWTGRATAVEQWVGGHSQRGPFGGASDATMRGLFAPGAEFGRQLGWEIDGERDDVPWFLGTHERSVVEYRLHMLRMRRVGL